MGRYQLIFEHKLLGTMIQFYFLVLKQRRASWPACHSDDIFSELFFLTYLMLNSSNIYQVHTVVKGSQCAQSCPTLRPHRLQPHQASLSMEFSRQEYWIGLPFPTPGDRPNPGMEAVSPASPALTGGFFTTSATREAQRVTMEGVREVRT